MLQRTLHGPTRAPRLRNARTPPIRIREIDVAGRKIGVEDEAMISGSPGDANRLVAVERALRRRARSAARAAGHTCAGSRAALDNRQDAPRRSVPVELGGKERRLGEGIGDLRRRAPIDEFREPRKLLSPPFAHGLGQVAVEIAEERKRLTCAPFLAHEQHRDLRDDEIDARERSDLLGRNKHSQPLAKGAVANLIVILDEGDKGVGRQRRARAAARLLAIGHEFALVCKALGDRRASRSVPP